MLSPSTVKTASQLARTVTESNQILVAVSGTPVDIMAEHYHVGAPGLKRKLSIDGYHYLTNRFAKHNAPQGGDIVEPGSEQRDQLVDLIASGVKGMLFKVRNSILPLCKAIHPEYARKVKVSGLPNISVKPLNYHSIHENDGLLSHIAEYPRKYKRETSYRSFVLSPPTPERVFEWLPQAATLADDVIREWMVSCVSESDIYEVWTELFSRREVIPEECYFTQRGRMPFSRDQLLAAYFLTSYLRDNPIDEIPQGERVSLEEWTQVMTKLHGMLGLKLIELYEKRQNDRKAGRLVYAYRQDSDMERFGMVLEVITNGDIFPDWIDQGGDVQALLGAATHHANMVFMKPINEAHDGLVSLWKRKHEIIKGKAANDLTQRRRAYLRQCLELSREHQGEHIPSLDDRTFHQRLDDSLHRLTETELEDDWRALVKLVCQVYYPDNDYYRFLCAMERYGVGIDSREAATLATVEITAQWLAQQAKLTSFTPLVVDSPSSIPSTVETSDVPADA